MVKLLEGKAKAKKRAKTKARIAKINSKPNGQIGENKTTFDFVGHITCPDVPQIKELVFETNPTKIVDIISDNGRIVSSTRRFDSDFKDFLISAGGYEITTKEIDAPNLYRSLKFFEIKCSKIGCIYYPETEDGVCKIAMKAKPEVLSKKNRYDPTNRKILISYNARDMRETTVKSDCICTFIKEKYGITALPDTYGRMGRC